jgi:hypothetical protein
MSNRSFDSQSHDASQAAEDPDPNDELVNGPASGRMKEWLDQLKLPVGQLHLTLLHEALSELHEQLLRLHQAADSLGRHANLPPDDVQGTENHSLLGIDPDGQLTHMASED